VAFADKMSSIPKCVASTTSRNRKGAHHMITISAFKWVPDFAQGQVRDLRARWALEEAGLPYKTRLLEQGDQDRPDYRALQPFGQVPILEEDGFVLFESGAIVLYIGERSEALLPKDVGARARATQWLIAALNSIEPFVMNVALIDLFYAKEEWAKLRRPGAVEFVQKRLSALSESLGEKPYLDGDRFTAGDGTANPQAHRHRHERTGPCSLCRTLHRSAGLQACDRGADWRFQRRRITGENCAFSGSMVASLRRHRNRSRTAP
jgi:glutathione S-transferase